MNITPQTSNSFRFSLEKDNEEIGHAYLFLITNNLHTEPYGLLEDLYVNPDHRGEGVGRKLIEAVIFKAKEVGCYKLLGTSRNEREKIHAWYQRIGFKNYGRAFRMDFD
jgi:GNAT superfamily N-acetyltransferase